MDWVEEVGKWIAGEGRVILQAPVSFLVSVALVGVAIFLILKAFFKERISVLDARLSHAQELADDYKNKLQGATPDEAAGAIRELQDRVRAIEPRRLTNDQRQRMREVLGRLSGSTIEVVHDGACPDANGYSMAFAHLLGEMGWRVSTPMVIGPGMRPPSGLAIAIPDIKAQTEHARALAEALRAAKIEFDLYGQHRGRESEITLLVTAPIRP